MSLLDTALQLIPAVAVKYQKYIGDTVNEIGITVPTYADEVTAFNAHSQPLRSSQYAEYGLQPGRNYRVFYVPADVIGVMSASENDLIYHGDKKFNIVTVSDWYGYDGWNRVVGVEIKNEDAVTKTEVETISDEN